MANDADIESTVVIAVCVDVCVSTLVYTDLEKKLLLTHFNDVEIESIAQARIEITWRLHDTN